MVDLNLIPKTTLPKTWNQLVCKVMQTRWRWWRGITVCHKQGF